MSTEINWDDPKLIARYGVEKDTAIAAELGVPYRRVSNRRRARGIASYQKLRQLARAGMDEELGTVPDHVLAAKYDCSIYTVQGRRRALGITAWRWTR